MGAHRVSFFTGHRDDSTASWHLEDVVAVMSHGHELGESWVAEDGVVRQANLGDVEVDELGTVVVVMSEGDREADLPYRGGGAVSNSEKRLGRLELIIWHLKVVEHLDEQHVKPCVAIDQSLGDLHVADDG